MDGKVIRFGGARVVTPGSSGLAIGADVGGSVFQAGQVAWVMPAPGGCHVGIRLGDLVLATPADPRSVLAAVGVNFDAPPPQTAPEPTAPADPAQPPAPSAEPPAGAEPPPA